MIRHDQEAGGWVTKDGLTPIMTAAPHDPAPPGAILGTFEQAPAGSVAEAALATDPAWIPCEHVPGLMPDELRTYFKPW